MKVVTRNGVTSETKLGRFVRSYRMGSGDGMTVHTEFSLNGVVSTVHDEMWGSVSGIELVWYKEYIPDACSESCKGCPDCPDGNCGCEIRDCRDK